MIIFAILKILLRKIESLIIIKSSYLKGVVKKHDIKVAKYIIIVKKTFYSKNLFIALKSSVSRAL